MGLCATAPIPLYIMLFIGKNKIARAVAKKSVNFKRNYEIMYCFFESICVILLLTSAFFLLAAVQIIKISLKKE